MQSCHLQTHTQTHSNRDNEDISNDVLKLEQFPVPQFMIDKMKRFMKSVQGRGARCVFVCLCACMLFNSKLGNKMSARWFLWLLTTSPYWIVGPA